MSFDYQTNVDSYAVADSTALIRKVYAWMCMALAITGLTAVFTASTPFMLNLIFSYQAVFFVMLLVGLIIASLVNIFLKSDTMGWIISIVGVIVFTGLTAYDTQKIKRMLHGAQTSEQTKKVALLGALSLYLDFVNLFLYLLRFLGNRR